MARRAPYTKVEKEGQERPSYVRDMGDVVFRGFQCLNGVCQEYVVVREYAVNGGSRRARGAFSRPVSHE